MNLNQVTVPSRDLSLSIPFYEKLGLILIVKSLPHYARFVCPSGEATFSLHEQKDLPKGQGTIVYFECEDLDDHVNRLIAKDIEFHELPTDKSWLWREARLRDLDGNQIILFHAGENRLYPPWRVDD